MTILTRTEVLHNDFDTRVVETSYDLRKKADRIAVLRLIGLARAQDPEARQDYTALLYDDDSAVSEEAFERKPDDPPYVLKNCVVFHNADDPDAFEMTADGRVSVWHCRVKEHDAVLADELLAFADSYTPRRSEDAPYTDYFRLLKQEREERLGRIETLRADVARPSSDAADGRWPSGEGTTSLRGRFDRLDGSWNDRTWARGDWSC